MNEQIQQIAERLAGLRDALEITPEEMAKVCNLTTEQYLLLESGTVDISVSVLHQISQAYGVELTTLMFGDEPKMSTYFITRNGKGVAVEPEAIAAVLRHYEGRIKYLSTYRGHINDDIQDRLKAQLIKAILQFRFDR